MARKKRLPNYLRQEEADRLLAIAQARVDRARTTKQRRRAQRDRLVVLTGILAGLRVAELTALEICHLDFTAKILQVIGGKGDRDRALPMADKLAGPLAEWIGERKDGYVFAAPSGKRLSTRTLQDRIPDLAKEAGLARRCKCHTLRHTFATRLVERGVDVRAVQELMGHSSLNTTMLYLSVAPERLRGAVDRL